MPDWWSCSVSVLSGLLLGDQVLGIFGGDLGCRRHCSALRVVFLVNRIFLFVLPLQIR